MKYKYINFYPFVGKQYFQEGLGGKRVLVLGESHYCSKELSPQGRCFPLCQTKNMLRDCHTQTIDVIEQYIHSYSGNRYEQTFLCFERAVSGKELTSEERVSFWNSIMFYNYLQFCQPGPRMPVAAEYWSPSEKAFKELLDIFSPDYIIIWGSRLYNGLPDWGGIHSILSADGDSTDVWTYTINGKSIPAIRVHHPSTPTGKAWMHWHQFYKSFLSI